MRNFVRNGGGYIGIGGGADLAVEKIDWLGEYLNFTLLGIFQGIAKSPITGINYPAMTQVNAANSTHPITQSGPATYQMLYNGGPRFIPNPEANVTILGRYEVGGEPAMIAFEYGNGKVFMIGTLPQENPGPNWELMSRVILWLTED